MTATVRKVSSLDEFTKQFEKKKGGSSSTLWPTRVGQNDRNSYSVRFLTEPNDWLEYGQWYTKADGYAIATEDNEDYFKKATGKKYPTTLYLAAAVDIETNQIIAQELKYTLAEDINAIRIKRGPITEYDIELSRRGAGTDTKYRASWDGASNLDLSRYELPKGFATWFDYLYEVYKHLLGDFDGEVSEDDDDEIEDDKDVAGEEAPAAPKRVLKKRV